MTVRSSFVALSASRRGSPIFFSPVNNFYYYVDYNGSMLRWRYLIYCLDLAPILLWLFLLLPMLASIWDYRPARWWPSLADALREIDSVLLILAPFLLLTGWSLLLFSLWRTESSNILRFILSPSTMWYS